MTVATRERSSRPALDWEAAHRQLDGARRLLERGSQRPPEEARRILAARARDLARRRDVEGESAETLDLLVCRLSEVRFGLELAHVLDVFVPAALTPVPCTAPFVLGVVGHRGRILSVVDFRLLLEPAAERVRGGLVVAVQAGGMEFGLAADEVAGVVRFAETEIAPPSRVPADGREHVTRGVTGTLVSVLDLKALARHSRLVVRDEMGQTKTRVGKP